MILFNYELIEAFVKRSILEIVIWIVIVLTSITMTGVIFMPIE